MAKTIITANDSEFAQLHASGAHLAFIREDGEDVWYRQVTDGDEERWFLVPKQTEKSSFGSPLVVNSIIFQAPYNPENIPEES